MAFVNLIGYWFVYFEYSIFFTLFEKFYFYSRGTFCNKCRLLPECATPVTCTRVRLTRITAIFNVSIVEEDGLPSTGPEQQKYTKTNKTNADDYY